MESITKYYLLIFFFGNVILLSTLFHNDFAVAQTSESGSVNLNMIIDIAVPVSIGLLGLFGGYFLSNRSIKKQNKIDQKEKKDAKIDQMKRDYIRAVRSIDLMIHNQDFLYGTEPTHKIHSTLIKIDDLITQHNKFFEEYEQIRQGWPESGGLPINMRKEYAERAQKLRNLLAEDSQVDLDRRILSIYINPNTRDEELIWTTHPFQNQLKNASS